MRVTQPLQAPRKKPRTMIAMGRFVEKAKKKLPTMMASSVSIIAGRRPYVSANLPQSPAVGSRPMTSEAAIHPATKPADSRSLLQPVYGCAHAGQG